MLRVCKPNGKILVSVWALEQDKNSRFKFRLGDNIVKWDDTTRYYHIHNKDTITDLLKSYNVESIFLDKGNWYFIIKNRIYIRKLILARNWEQKLHIGLKNFLIYLPIHMV